MIESGFAAAGIGINIVTGAPWESTARPCMGGWCLEVRDLCARYHAEGIAEDKRICSPGTTDAFLPLPVKRRQRSIISDKDSIFMVEIIVFGNPAPQGSKKFVGVNKAGRGIMVESVKSVRPWRMDVKAAAEEVMRSRGDTLALDGPLVVSMVFTLAKPSSAPKRRTTYPDRKPDLSKLVRSTEDALTDAGFWVDDARVVEYSRLAKVFPCEDIEALPRPGVRIKVGPRSVV